MADLKQVAFSNALWKFVERVGAQGVSLIVSILLARLLSPEDYGAISMVTIFITIADVFVNKGLGSALIQKKDADELDYSSILIVNVGLSCVLYGITFLASPLVAAFFEMPILCSVMRVLGLQTIICGFSSIMHSYISKNMLFRKTFAATLISSIISAIIGISMALLGFGVWALVAQQLVSSALNTFVLFITVNWRPKAKFSMTRVAGMLPFGLRILGAALVDVIFRQIRQLIIGKKYTSEDLAYFNKGSNFPQLIVSNVNIAVTSVLYPVLSGMQNNKVQFLNNTRTSLRLTSYLYFPLMAGLAAIAPSFVSVLLTDTWLPCVPYLQVYCFEYATWCIQTTHETAVKSSGNSKLLLYAEITRKMIILVILLFSMQYGMTGIAVSVVAGTITNVIAFSLLSHTAVGYSLRMQLQDIASSFLLVVILWIAVYPLNNLPIPPLLKMLLQIFVGVATYVTASIVLKNKEWTILKTQLIQMAGRKT